ncbi:MAG TPA: FtsX-like permease family protein [Steroidobacteraceae bacterium]|nr:FtsX-like permease family protein [Steroidobacteraceae bacterium]
MGNLNFEIRPLLSALWRNRTGPLLVALQVAIALAVLVNVAYVVEQRIATARQPTGIDLQNVFWILSQGYAPDYNQAVTVKTDLAYLNSLPGVIAAATFQNLPQIYSEMDLPFATTPKPNAPSEEAIVYMMSARGTEALGLKLIAGRAPLAEAVAGPATDFNQAAGRWAAEALITQDLAERLFPKGDALGKTLYAQMINRPAKIVGIVEHMQAMPAPQPYDRLMQRIVFVPVIAPGPRALYLVRTQPGRRAAVMAKVEKEFGPLQPGRFIMKMAALDETAALTRNRFRATAVILGVVGVLVTIVTAIGIFGLAAFHVATRTKQIGTRRAIGARRLDILRYFLVENGLITTVGVGVGCTLALAIGVKLSLMLQAPRLPLYYLVGGALALWSLGLCAVLLPARQATRISPAVATRTV